MALSPTGANVMPRQPHDQFAKQYLKGLLTPFSEESEISLEISPGEPQQVDLWFTPNPQLATQQHLLGLLGQMLTTPALLEAFRNPAPAAEICACLNKLLLLQAHQRRDAKRQKQKILDSDLPHLWILVPTASPRLLTSFRAEPQAGWSEGVYFLAPALRTAIVVIHQLPTHPDTLWLRLLGRGTVQRSAIAELMALANHPLQRQALAALAQLQITLQRRHNLSRSEQEIAMNLSPVYEQWLAETLEQGRQEGQRADLEALLMAKFDRLDEGLASIIPQLMALSPSDRARLILQSSRQELLEQFQAEQS
ncbi:hypothetical protein [Trichothermofontia sp.]